ncbi:MAG: hypothetical protein ABI667_04605 [Sphingomicrobium sp.]
MLKVLFVLAAVAAQSGPAATDLKSDDAVTAFGDLCVNLFTDKPSKSDPTRFSVTKLSENEVSEIKPDLKGQTMWDVSGTKSDVHMLVHYEPGMCVVEVAEADETALRVEFERLVQQTSTRLGSVPQRQSDTFNRIDGKDATTSMWRMKSAKGDVMLAVTTYPDPKFMIQHLMTVSYVR